mgnify:CR=1 FL=1
MGVAALIRLGTEPAPRKPKFSQPRFIDAVAAGFPELKTTIAPCGHGWWVEYPDMAASRPNLYVDFSG